MIMNCQSALVVNHWKPRSTLQCYSVNLALGTPSIVVIDITRLHLHSMKMKRTFFLQNKCILTVVSSLILSCPCVVGNSSTTVVGAGNENTGSIGHGGEEYSFNWRRTISNLPNEIGNTLEALTGQKADLSGSITEIKIGLLENLSKIGLNPFTIFDLLIKTWRNSLPTLAPIGSYTLLQLALVLALGGLTAGAAVFAGEAIYFKTLHEEEELHHHLRREYDLRHGLINRDKESGSEKNRRKVDRKATVKNVVTLPPNRFKPQSLKRTQRRNQRKNKNAGEQLENYKREQLAKAKANQRKGRPKRQLTFPNVVFPTVAPRPLYFQRTNQNELPPPRLYYPPQRYPTPRPPPDENIFSLTYVSNFLRRHSFIPTLKSFMPNIPWFDSSTKLPHHTTENQQQHKQPNKRFSYAQAPLNAKKNMINRSFTRVKKNR